MLNINLKEGNRNKAEQKHDERLLRRLQTLLDVVYGVILVQLFMNLPAPEKEMLSGMKLWEALQTHGAEFSTVAIGIIFIIIYWGQSHDQFGYLKRTNKVVSILTIVQLVMLLLYLYSIILETESQGDKVALIMQSSFLACAGFIGAFCWKYAALNKMHFDEMGAGHQYRVYYGFFPEPTAALFTLPFAILSPNWYLLSWLSVIPLGMLFTAIGKRKEKELSSSGETP